MSRLMKKLILAIVSALLLSDLAADAAVQQLSRTVAPFSSISVSDAFTVRLVRGSDSRVLLSVEEAYADYVTCDVVGYTLTISLDERKVPLEVRRQFRGKGTPDPVFSAVVYVPELLKSVTLTDKAVLTDTEDVFDKASVSFSLSGSSSVKSLSLSSRSLRISMQNKSVADFTFVGQTTDVETSNSSHLTIDDSSDASSYFLQGSSKINAKCRTKEVSVRTKSNCVMLLTGSGDSAVYDINGTSEVDASSFDVPDAKVSMSSVCKLSQSAYRSLTVNLNGGSTLYFGNEPQVTVENIKSATMSRIASGQKTSS